MKFDVWTTKFIWYASVIFVGFQNHQFPFVFVFIIANFSSEEKGSYRLTHLRNKLKGQILTPTTCSNIKWW